MIEHLLFYVLGLTIGWYFSRHRHITHENSRPPTGAPPLKLKRSKPIRMDEGTIQRGNGYSGPTTTKPDIIPQPMRTRFPTPSQIAECGGPCFTQGREACDCGLKDYEPSTKPRS